MQSPKQTAVARLLRKHDTWAEKLLWSWLRDRRFSAYKFRRQHPFGPHILDFFCPEARMDIELDGMQHGYPDQHGSDAERDGWLDKTNPQLEIGICGEHGGEPSSVQFCYRVGMNYVSCSPYRVPIARLAAAQAAISGDKSESMRTA